MSTRGARGLAFGLIVLLTLASEIAHGATASVEPTMFETPEEAFQMLAAAVRADDTKALLGMLGKTARPLISSGDPVADRAARAQFVQAYDASHQLQAGQGVIVLVIGRDNFPFPIPLVPDGPKWRFDAAAGEDEILRRAIGRNELGAVQVCLAYADAQRQYYAEARDSSDVLQFAQRLGSTTGKRDGLYWPTKAGEPRSPLGERVARARADGAGSAPAMPFFGYLYRILTAQGPDAAGGAYGYLANGKMIGGFALVASPARWGASGVMTFLVNHDGAVYEKNLGPKTAEIARQMKSFNPDQSWKRVEP
jgi:hypothetical protein